ncbi:ferric reductase-like transmembrane domain-containing protein [Brevibacillus migulae]|uniref:ferric reductase-like transmembrane domain-containing protein n=1 Tax=Brevibacillus migulae TaxID=1644114 RepID=UPI00106F09E6|nr:ferric reductase-like transmembrane domain-containing protein [Brevibacillus migulae]
MDRFFKLASSRFRLTGALLLVVAIMMLLDFLYGSFAFLGRKEAWSMILGYLSFILIAVTLVIGPVKMWLPPSWSRQLLSLRRDIGIAGGCAAALHVILVLIMYEQGPKLIIMGQDSPQKGWWRLFFEHYPDGTISPNLSLTGYANYMGAICILIILSLTLTSSTRAERLLGGAAWKRLHMNNLLLFILVSFHAVIYVGSIKGSPHHYPDIVWVTAIVLLIRICSFWVTVWKRRKS